MTGNSAATRSIRADAERLNHVRAVLRGLPGATVGARLLDALRAERDAIEHRQYADLLRLREIRGELAGLDDDQRMDG